jgi:hypothetical protein
MPLLAFLLAAAAILGTAVARAAWDISAVFPRLQSADRPDPGDARGAGTARHARAPAIAALIDLGAVVTVAGPYLRVDLHD